MTSPSDSRSPGDRAFGGTWTLVGWETLGADGEVTHPLGREPWGQLMYDSDAGTVSAQLVATGQPRFASDDWQAAATEEMAAAWPKYFGYFGTFTVDEADQTVTHHIRAGWFPNLAGTEQARHYEFRNDLLTLEAETAWGAVRIVWRRARAAE
ncbi:MAG TPA: lipocalin-like domain-containing protein [Marmoricola sp.]|nr:lipocalin-like domain-containing protein [Marmoricola sp.]